MNVEKSEELEVKKIIEELGSAFGKNSVAENQALSKVMEKGISPKDGFGISPAKMEAIYGQAYSLYNTGKYRDAVAVFHILIMLDSTEVRYSMGLAASFHLLKDYQNAISVYTLCLALEPNNPILFFHLSDCYYQMNDKASALVTLEMAVKRAGDRPEYQILKDRALLTMESIKKDLEKLVAQRNPDADTNLA